MSLIHLYYNPTTEFDRLFEDAFAVRFRPRACAPPSTRYRDTVMSTVQGNPSFPVYSHIFSSLLNLLSSLDLHESKDTNTVTATFELPGFTSEGVAIDVHQNRLTVSGESAASDSEEERNYIIRERRSGKFSRTLQLSIGIKVSPRLWFLLRQWMLTQRVSPKM